MGSNTYVYQRHYLEFTVKKSTINFLIGLVCIIGSGIILYMGHEVRANPEAFSDLEKLTTVVGNFAGIIGIAVGCLGFLNAIIGRLIEKDEQSSSTNG